MTIIVKTSELWPFPCPKENRFFKKMRLNSKTIKLDFQPTLGSCQTQDIPTAFNKNNFTNLNDYW